MSSRRWPTSATAYAGYALSSIEYITSLVGTRNERPVPRINVGAIHRVTMTSFRSISMPAGFRRHLVGKLSEMFLTVMGVNATGTLGGHRLSAEDARIEAP